MGCVNVKEMFFLASDSVPNTTEALPVRSVLIVSDSDSAADVMNRFIYERFYIAVARNAAGRTTGIERNLGCQGHERLKTPQPYS